MATVDLRSLPANEFVLHFGGRPNEVDAYTFSNSLLSISEAIQEINRQLDPSHSIEIAIEALNAGSFRARLRTHAKSISGLLRSSARDLIIGVLASVIVTRYFDEKTRIIVLDDSYVVEKDGDRIILPKRAVDAAKALPQPDRVQRHIAKTFEILEDDPSVTEFGISSDIHNSGPTALVARNEFAQLAVITEEARLDETRRFVDERAKLVVLKAIFERSERRWQFVWNSIRISASIKDTSFFDKLASREYTFAQGDILDVTLRIHQHLEEMSRIFINERYEVIAVHGLIQRPRQELLPLR
jgi:hypothetical protein